MQFEMTMPKMGESITEGTIVKWLKKPGDTIERDEIILEISTDKVDSEIPTPAAGVIMRFLANEGDTIGVGLPIAIIETAAGSAPDEKSTAVEMQVPAEKTISLTSASPAPENNRFYSPVVLNIARDNGLSPDDLQRIPGSGLNGRLTRKDLLGYLSRRPAVKPSFTSTKTMLTESGIGGTGPVETIPMDHIRKSIAKHMVHSLQTAAQVALYTEADVNAVYKIRERSAAAFKAREGFSLTYMPFIVEALVKALKEFPYLNASIDQDAILLKKFYHIGMAVSVNNGLIVPNIFNADEKNLLGLARAINDLAIRARSRKLRPDETANGTFSVSNFGVYGTTIGFPIINQPQAAILGVGAVKKRAVVINDAIAIRPILYLSLSIDHRLIDGAMGSQFLQRVAGLLEELDENLVI
jgi:2-oxoglutarate dehydrogenase E2 component (dihydrolipoamide succinyltransferase)